MAGPLASVERFFERLFERPAARLFQARIEPVQLQRSLERAMEAERRVSARRAYAPAEFRVLLSAADATALGNTTALVQQLGEALRVYARGHGYVLLARPRVTLETSSVVAQGDVRVYVEPLVLPAELIAQPLDGRTGGTITGDDGASAEAAVDLGQATAVFAAPRADPPRAVLAVRSPGRPITRVPVKPGTLRLGRSLDNDVVLADDRVSRHHGQVGVRLGMLVYTDLGSTNGSYLGGSAVTEIALGPGDVLQLGSSTVTIEPAT